MPFSLKNKTEQKNKKKSYAKPIICGVVLVAITPRCVLTCRALYDMINIERLSQTAVELENDVSFKYRVLRYKLREEDNQSYNKLYPTSYDGEDEQEVQKEGREKINKALALVRGINEDLYPRLKQLDRQKQELVDRELEEGKDSLWIDFLDSLLIRPKIELLKKQKTLLAIQFQEPNS